MTDIDPIAVFRPDLLEGQVALVTGAASGIGRACAGALARVGATVAMLDVDEAGCVQAASELTQSASARPYVADLLDVEGLDGLVDGIAAELGPVRILVNAAADLVQGTFLDSSVPDWERALRVNVLAPFALVRAVGQRLLTLGMTGAIVNVGSSSAYRAVGTGGRYGVSKSAVAGLTRAAAGELGGGGIRVNTVAPGLTRTPAAMRNFRGDEALAEAVRSGPMANLLGSVTEADDIAAAVLFLCLPSARQITASVVHVSAGSVVG